MRTTLAQSRRTGYIVIGMGFGLLFLLNVDPAGTVETMTRSPIGQVALVVGGALFAVGFLLIRRMTRIDGVSALLVRWSPASGRLLAAILFVVRLPAGARRRRSSAGRRGPRPAARGAAREARGLGPLERLAAPAGAAAAPAARPAPASPRLQRRIDQAGRPDGLTVDIFLRADRVVGVLIVPRSSCCCSRATCWARCWRWSSPRRAAARPRSPARSAGARERIDRDLPTSSTCSPSPSRRASASAPRWPGGERFEGPLAEEILFTLSQIGNGASRAAGVPASCGSAPVRGRGAVRHGASCSRRSSARRWRRPSTRSPRTCAARAAQRQRQTAARTAPRVTLVTSMVLVPGALVLVVVGLLPRVADVDFGALFGSARCSAPARDADPRVVGGARRLALLCGSLALRSRCSA